jgi:exosortase
LNIGVKSRAFQSIWWSLDLEQLYLQAEVHFPFPEKISVAGNRSFMTEISRSEFEQPRLFRLDRCRQWDGIALWLPLIGFSPLLFLQGMHLWDRPHLQFFPVTIAVVCWIAFTELPKEKKLDGGVRFWFAVATLAFSFAVILAAFVFYSPWLAQLATMVAFVGWALVRLFATPLSRIATISVLLFSTLPLPFDIDQLLISKLQNWSSNACASALDALQVANFLQGNILHIEQHTLFVEEACSGVTSLYSLISLALIFVVTQRRSLFHSALILFMTPLVAINGNILRLILIALGFQWGDVDLTKGYAHDVVGLVAFLSSAVALVCFNQLISLLFAPIPKLKSEKSLFRRCYNTVVEWPTSKVKRDEIASKTELVEGKEERRLPATEVTTFAIGPFSLFPILCVVYTAMFIPVLSVVVLKERSVGAYIPADIAAEFPSADLFNTDTKNGWKMSGYHLTTRNVRSNTGQYSHTWRLVKGEKIVIFSLDFAFLGWHGLEGCYRSSGWKVLDFLVEEKSGDEWSWVECKMVNAFGSDGYLWYSLFDEDGAPYNQVFNERGVGIRLPRQTILNLFDEKSSSGPPYTFQVQIFIESGRALSDEERVELTELFLELREVIRKRSMPAINQLKDR